MRGTRLTAAILTLVLAVLSVGTLPDLARGSTMVGFFTVIYICAAAGLCVTLSRTDNSAVWAVIFYLAAITVWDIPLRNTIGYFVMPAFVGRWGPLDVALLATGYALMVVAGKVVVDRFGLMPALGLPALLLVHATGLALLPSTVERAPALSIVQTFLGLYCLIAACLVLIAGIGTWITTLLVGLLVGIDHVYELVSGTSALLGSRKPWWQVTSWANALAGVVLIVVACRSLFVLWRRSRSEPAGGGPGGGYLRVEDLVAIRRGQSRNQLLHQLRRRS